MQAECTETPWRLDTRAATRIVGANGRGVAASGGPFDNGVEDGGLAENEANARHIVRCVNSHDALLAACKAVVEECDETFVDPSEMSPAWQEIEKQCRAAISLAEQEPTDAHE